MFFFISSFSRSDNSWCLKLLTWKVSYLLHSWICISSSASFHTLLFSASFFTNSIPKIVLQDSMIYRNTLYTTRSDKQENLENSFPVSLSASLENEIFDLWEVSRLISLPHPVILHSSPLPPYIFIVFFFSISLDIWELSSCHKFGSPSTFNLSLVKKTFVKTFALPSPSVLYL